MQGNKLLCACLFQVINPKKKGRKKKYLNSGTVRRKISLSHVELYELVELKFIAEL